MPFAFEIIVGRLRFALHPLPPFRLDLTALALQRRPINQMDSWNGETYSRVLTQGGRPVLVEVRQKGGTSAPRLDVMASSGHRGPTSDSALVDALDKLLGLRVDMRPFYLFAETDPRLGPLSRRYMGLKPPRFPSVFEGIINGIACLLSLRGIGRWTAEYVLLRGLGRTDLFPGDDVGARNNLKRWLKLGNKLDYASVNTVTAKWRPFAGLLYFHLLLDGMETPGNLPPERRIGEAA